MLSDAAPTVTTSVHRVLTQKVFPRQATVVTVAEWVTSLDT